MRYTDSEHSDGVSSSIPMDSISVEHLASTLTCSGQVLVCTITEGTAHASLSRPRKVPRKNSRKDSKDDQTSGGGLPVVQSYILDSPDRVRAVLKTAGPNCPIVLVLPRTQYLTREFLLPVVAEAEVAGMVALETESEAPPGMEEIEVAYRSIGEPIDGQQRYEVFFARQSGLTELLSQADALCLGCDHILPNGVLLEWLLNQSEASPQMLVYASGPGQLEIAARKEDGRLTVRSLGDLTAGRLRLAQVIGEMTRSVRREEEQPVSLAWLGVKPEDNRLSETLPWIDEKVITMDDLFTGPSPSKTLPGAGEGAVGKEGLGVSEDLSPAVENTSGGRGGGYLGVLGVGLLDAGVLAAARQVDLMPQSRRNAKLMRRVVVSSLWTGGGLVAALVLVSVGLWLFASRYEAHRDQLAEQIRAIEVEGRGVSRRIDQLDAMHDTWDRRNLMRDVLTALYEASPQGLEYHQVEIKEDGSCYLRGQAQSVALPFELPERLEAQPIFTDVTLADAGQARRGAGTVTEFRIDCRVVVPPPVSPLDNPGQQARGNP